MQARKLIAALAPTAIALVLVGAGFFAGYYAVVRIFDRDIRRDAEAYTLGGLLKGKPEQKKAVAGAYKDSDTALAELDDYSWAVPSIPTPFVGAAPAPGQHGSAHINAMQMRASGEVAMPKPEGTYRLFLTGGSTAYGNGAPSNETTVGGYLESLLATELAPTTGLKYEVFTFANSAWASTHERIAIENRLSELDPDMIVALSGNNDVHWGALGRNVLWFRTYADEHFLSLMSAVYRLADRAAIPDSTPIEPGPVAPALVAERLKKNVRIGAFVLSDRRIDYVFALQPTLAVTNKQLSARERRRLVQQDYFRACYALIASGLETLPGEHFRFVDLRGIFDAAGENEEIFLDSYHFGDRGNERIAQALFHQIRDRVAHRESR